MFHSLRFETLQPWFYAACLMNFESFDLLAHFRLSNRSVERIKVIANLIINLLPRRLPLKDFVFLSNPCGNFIPIPVLRADCYC
jgi:hypothetical protein